MEQFACFLFKVLVNVSIKIKLKFQMFLRTKNFCQQVLGLCRIRIRVSNTEEPEESYDSSDQS